ncbi:Hypothetical predicted protein [Paramuricea clavata]|uniref:Uncharacterized protein n=1 Tax=Paramuricea clavata TaxID=317549 RepID=A0A6S7FHX0_PARCT|nr:Hypothetical predicted protein [Paramuricea clavata]
MEKDKNLSQEQSSVERFLTQIREVTESKEKLTLELEAANETTVEQRNIIDQLTLQLAEREKTINEKEQQSVKIENELKNEMNQLQQQLSLTTSEAIDLRNELTRTKDEYDEVILRIKQEAEQLNEKYNEDAGKHESTSQEVTSLRAQISELKQDLNASLSASVAREQETSGQVESLEKTRNELVAELNRCIEQGKKQKVDVESQKLRIDQLEQEKSSLQSIVLSQERKVSEIHEKLQQTERKLAEQEGVVSYERHRNTDTNQRLDMSVGSLSNMRQECETLREELRVLSEKLLKQHDAALESQSKYDSLITQLRTEMQHERETYAVERHKLASHLEQAVKESKDFSSLLRQREEELGHLRSEFNATSRTGTKASTALEFESRLRQTLENKNSTLESELAKAWGQTKSLMERLATIEADKGQLERELERKSQMYQLTEDSLQKKDADVVSLMVARDTAEQRAETAELKLMSMQREKENVQQDLERSQKDLGEAYQMKAELEMTREESFTLKSQLDDEEQNRSLHRLTIDELKRQVDMLHGRENQAYDQIDELQKIVKDYEHKVEVLQNKLRKVSDDHKMVEDEGKTVVEKLNEIRHANDQLQVDLVVAAERIEYLESKCERRKMKAIHKIQSLKEKFEREKRTANAAMLSLQNTLELSRKKIQKEEEWKQTTDGVRKQLVEEKQDLLTRLTESEEIIREHLRNLREAETRLSVMEKENLELRDKVNIVMRQNEHLERLNRILEKPENQSRSPLNSAVNNQSLYDALNRIRLHESLNSTDYSPQTSITPAYRTPDKSVNSLDASFIVSPPSGTLVVT